MLQAQVDVAALKPHTLTDDQWATVVEIYKRGQGPSYVATELGVSKGTAAGYTKRLQDAGVPRDVEPARSGKAKIPRELIPEIYEAIKNGADRKQFYTKYGVDRATLRKRLERYAANNGLPDLADTRTVPKQYKTAVRREQAKAATKHGLYGSPTQVTYKNMKARASNPNRNDAKHYAGKGIQMCARYRDGEGQLSGLECFVEDLGLRPSKEHSCDRIDNATGYTCGKCADCEANGWTANLRWAIGATQNRNRSNTVWIAYEGEQVELAKLIERFRPELFSPEFDRTKYKRVASRFYSRNTDSLTDKEIRELILAKRVRTPGSRQGKGGGGSKPGDRPRGDGRAKTAEAETERRRKISEARKRGRNNAHND